VVTGDCKLHPSYMACCIFYTINHILESITCPTLPAI
jgi:hypothetical protein